MYVYNIPYNRPHLYGYFNFSITTMYQYAAKKKNSPKCIMCNIYKF